MRRQSQNAHLFAIAPASLSILLSSIPAAFAAACSSTSSTESSATDGGDDATSQTDASGGAEASSDAGVAPGDASPGSDAEGGAAEAGRSEAGNEGGDAGGGAEGGDGGPGADGAPDAAESGVQVGPDASDAAPDSSAACNTTVTNTAPVVVSTVLSGPAPTLAGGSIVPGTYYVTGYQVLPSVDAGSNGIGLGSWQETAMIAGTTITEVQATSGSLDGGVGPDQFTTFTFSTSGSSLSLTPACGTLSGVSSLPYQVNVQDGGVTTFEVLITNVLLTLTKQ